MLNNEHNKKGSQFYNHIAEILLFIKNKSRGL